MDSRSMIEVNGKQFYRIPVKTGVLKPGDDFIEIIIHSTKGILEKGDIISVSESPLAITQGRAILIKDIKVGFLASVLWRFVSKVNYGIGLRSPTSMQCAIDEAGHLRIIIAAFVSVVTKVFGAKGFFYRVAGEQVALIDAANTSPIPPYDKCVIKGPVRVKEFVDKVYKTLGHKTAVMDINDIGGVWMLEGSEGLSKDFMESVMSGNPQGQGDELTPICLIREKL